MQRAQISVSVWRNIAPVYREGDQDCNQGRRGRNGCRVARARVHIANHRLARAPGEEVVEIWQGR